MGVCKPCIEKLYLWAIILEENAQMAKEKTVYVCSNCGQDSPKWVGKCPSCGMWNTYVEEVVRKEVVNKRPVSGIETAKAKPVTLHEIVADDEPRIDTRFAAN